MKKELALTNKEYIAKYPVGTRILWSWNDKWVPGIVIEPQGKRPLWGRSVWFILGREIGSGIDISYAARFVGYEYQHLIKLGE